MSVATSLTVAELIGDIVGDHDTRLDTAEGNISTLQSDVSTAQSDISTNQGNISTLQFDVSTAQSDISTNQGNISTLQSDVSTAQSDISTNQGNISTLQSDVSTAQSDISTNQGNISTLQSDVSTAQSDISTNQGNISTLQSDVSTAQSDISTNQGNISTLQSDVSTAQSDISTLQSDKLDASDGRVPTQDENDALVGTGTPSSSNVFVTQDTHDNHSHTVSDITDAGSAASENAGTGANEVLKLDGSGKLSALLLNALLSHPDLVGAGLQNYGADSDLSFSLIDNQDRSAYPFIKNGMLFLANSDGNFQVPVGLAVQKDSGEMDIEVVLADGSRVSVGSLDGDDLDIDGNPYRPGFQLDTYGATAPEQYIQGRGF